MDVKTISRNSWVNKTIYSDNKMKSELSKFIKKEAFKIGFNKIGIAKPEVIKKEDAKNLDLWLDKGNHAEMEWIKNRRDEKLT